MAHMHVHDRYYDTVVKINIILKHLHLGRKKTKFSK